MGTNLTRGRRWREIGKFNPITVERIEKFKATREAVIKKYKEEQKQNVKSRLPENYASEDFKRG